MYNDFLIEILLSILLGALIGAQREIRQQKRKVVDFAGFRTYTLICLFGYLVGFLSFKVLDVIEIVLFAMIGIFILSIFAYKIVSKIDIKNASIASEVSAFLTFFLGILVSLGLYQIAITFSIFITLILFLGNALHKFAKKINYSEMFATLKFAIISFIILPILPNKNYTLLDFPLIGEFLQKQSYFSIEVIKQLDVFNPFNIWLMVIFISGIAYVGYILMKIVGPEKGIEVTGFLGGLMSSTALTSSFSIESKRLNYLAVPLVVGVVIASSTMFFRILFEVMLLNPSLLGELVISLGIMGFTGFVCAFYLMKKKKLNHVKQVKLDSPFSIGPALKFAVFFSFILFISKFFTIIFGEKGIYLVAFVSGFADVDAITISLSKLALDGSISSASAVLGIVLAAFSNTFFKAGIAYYFGSKDFFKGILIIFGIIVVVGFISLIFL